MKIKTPTIQNSKHDRYAFELIIPKEWSTKGQRQRRYFETKPEAEAALVELLKDRGLTDAGGGELANMPIELRLDACQAKKLIAHIPKATLRLCAEDYAKAYAARARAGSLDELIAERIKALENPLDPAKPKTVRLARHSYDLLTRWIQGSTNIATITSDQLCEGLTQLPKLAAKLAAEKEAARVLKRADKKAAARERAAIKASNRGLARSKRRSLGKRTRTDRRIKGGYKPPTEYKSKTLFNAYLNWFALFKLAVKKGFLAKNPMADVVRPKILTPRIEVLSPLQLEALLAAAIQHDPSWVPFLAIAGFAGARRSEILELRWEDIDLAAAGIALDDHITKTASRRRLKIQLNLIEWLRPFEQKCGFVVKPRLAPQLDAIRKHLCTMCGIGKWPHNALRHSFGSYFFELFGVEETMREMGHASRAMLDKNYRQLVTPQAAKRFFAIFPPKDLAEIVAEHQAKQARNSVEAEPTISSI